MTDYTDYAPAWDGCELVRDKDGDLWTISTRSPVDGAPVYTSYSWLCDYPAAEVEAKVGPCTPVLGPEGQPVVTQDDVEVLFDELRTVRMPWSFADLEHAVKRRLYVWEAQ